MSTTMRNTEKNACKIRIFATVLSLFVLPECWGYSITSSLGPSFEYEPFSSVTGASARQSSGSLMPTRVSTAQPPSQLSQLMLSAAGLRTNLDSNQGYSHFIYSRQSDSSNFMRPILRQQAQESQFSPAQLQIASRIHYESHLIDTTTTKVLTGYRSFPSSYRNPNYFGKKTKSNENRSNVKRYFPNINDNEEIDQTRVQVPQNKFPSVVVPTPSHPDSVKHYGNGPMIIYPGNLNIPVATTPESRTAPATILSSSATDRPSSTQQMQSDGSYYASAGLDSSASTNHYQYSHNGGQRLRSVEEDRSSVHLAPRDIRYPSHSRSPINWSHNASHHVKNHSFRNLTSASANFSSTAREVEDEPIVFPTTLNPTQRTYKIPGQSSHDDTDLSGLRNILEGETTEHNKKEFSIRRGSSLPTKDIFGTALEGVMDLDCAKSLGYCEKDTIKENYPKDLLNSVLTNSISSDLFKKVFGDVVDGSGLKSKDATDDVVLAGRNNINVLTQETQLCVSQEVTIYPRVARNKDDKWMFVVNHDDYVQGVKVEKCMNEGGACPFSEGNPLGYESVCRQKYILRKLVALNDDGKTALDTFKLPSCCVCYIKSNYVSDRTGVVSSSASRNPAHSDNGVVSSSVRGGHTEPEDSNDSPPVACAEKVPPVSVSHSNSSSLTPHITVASFNTSTVANTTLS